MQLPGSRVGGVELDADVEHRALDRVATHAAVTVPREVGQAGLRAGHLDDDAMPVEPIGGGPQLRAAERADAHEPRVDVERGDDRRSLVEVVDAVADVDAVDRRPPRALIVGAGIDDRGVDVAAHRLDLVVSEDATEVDVAGAPEEVADLVVAVVEREGSREVQRRTLLVGDLGRAGEVEHRLPVERGAQGRLPSREVTEAPPGERHAVGVQQREA